VNTEPPRAARPTPPHTDPELAAALSRLPQADDYALVIDARSPHEFADDHIPGAVNLPVANDEEFAEVGRTYKRDPHAAYVVGAQFALRNIAEHVGKLISQYDKDDRFLVYCYRGGKRSRAWAAPLEGIGFRTEVLPGGWKAYRRAVLVALEKLPARFDYRVLSGATGCGKTRLLAQLEQLGEQVVDLEGLAAHRGSLLGLVPGTQQPTQKFFDGLLVKKLRQLDPARPVWIEAESKKVGNVQLPDALLHAMKNNSQRIEITAPLPERVKLLRTDYPHLVDEPQQLLQRLAPLKPLVGGGEIERWKALLDNGQIDELVERVLVMHYDPCYARSHRRSAADAPPGEPVELRALGEQDIREAAAELAQRFGPASHR
jgi:tRNA 2-selenouridine synthase